MKILKNTFLLPLAFLLFFQGAAIAAPLLPGEEKEESIDTARNLKVLSWNIYMLPPIVPGNDKIERAHAIVEELKNDSFDVIVFQEAFLKDARKVISEGLKDIYPYAYGPANSGGFTIRESSGVLVISKIELKLLNTIQFKNCALNDCFARKGAMLLEGVWHGKPFQILGTHLQADGFDKIREKQMDQIYLELLAEHKKDGVPQILCGDMNTESEMKAHYCSMLDCLNAEDGDISGIEKCSYDGENNPLAQAFGVKKKVNYDYILVRNNGAKMKSTKRFVSVLRMKKGKGFLSDHYGIVCELKF
ncbi:MAG TPA: sphingomyelin phosphodiesterase [Chitinophagales bacterium]|nr:sphingomyelin phosphodiesterase [Chitinophagales bacterium]